MGGRTLTARSLGQLLREVLGTRVRLARCEVLKAADEYLILHADLGRRGSDVTLKLAGPGAPLATPFDRSAYINDLVRRAGVPT
jgi:hypothetical protein